MFALKLFSLDSLRSIPRSTSLGRRGTFAPHFLDSGFNRASLTVQWLCGPKTLPMRSAVEVVAATAFRPQWTEGSRQGVRELSLAPPWT